MKFHGMGSCRRRDFAREPRGPSRRFPSPPAPGLARWRLGRPAGTGVGDGGRRVPERRKSVGQAECPRGRTASLARPLAARGREEEIAEARAGPGVFHPLQRAVATGTGHGTPEGLALAFAEVNHCCGAMSHHRPGQTLLRRTASPLPLLSAARSWPQRVVTARGRFRQGFLLQSRRRHDYAGFPRLDVR